MARQQHHKALKASTHNRRRSCVNKKPTSVPRPYIRRDARNSRFQYQPLNMAQNSFRLLHLHPGDEEDPIRCTVFNAVISDWKGKYTAGSYVWGSKKNRRRIFIDGHQFCVTRNLFDFLCACRLHHQTQPLTLWIDAICIDQKSIGERNHQVSIMAEIYSNAGCTYSWLGHSQDDSAWLFSTLSSARIRDLIREKEKQSRTSLGASLSTDEWELIERGMEAMSKLASREYWKRIWIIQEVSLSETVYLLCGAHSLSWKDIPFGIIKFLEEKLLRPDMERLRCSLQYTTIFHLQNEKGPLLRLLGRSFETVHFAFGHLSCSVPQDSIFALLSLAATADEQARSFQVDYTMSVPKLFIKVLQHFQHRHPMALLISIMGSSRPSPSRIAHWQHDEKIIVLQLKRDDNEMQSLREHQLQERPFPMPGLHIHECSSSSGAKRRFSTCCYLDTNNPQDLKDELYDVGIGEFLIVRHQQFTPPKVVGIALAHFGCSSNDWQVDLVRPYLEHAERLVRSLLVLSERPWLVSEHEKLVVQVDFQYFLPLAWISRALFGERHDKEAGDPYWKQSSKAMLKLLGYKPHLATWEAEMAAFL